MLNRFAVPLVLLIFGPLLFRGTALLPTVGGAALAQTNCYMQSYRANTILICPVDECQMRGSVLTCASLGRFKQYCATHPGIPHAQLSLIKELPVVVAVAAKAVVLEGRAMHRRPASAFTPM